MVQKTNARFPPFPPRLIKETCIQARRGRERTHPDRATQLHHRKRVLPFGRKSNYDVCKMAPNCPSVPGKHISGRLYEILFIWFLSEIE